MSWEIEIDGKALSEKFETEEAANQHAANVRGQNWQMKIVVRDLNAPKVEAQPTVPAPITTVVEAAGNVLPPPAKTERK